MMCTQKWCGRVATLEVNTTVLCDVHAPGEALREVYRQIAERDNGKGYAAVAVITVPTATDFQP